MNMSNRFYALGTSANPIVQVLSLLAFGVLLIGAVVMGAVILSAVFGLAVIAAAVFSIRLWWLKRKLGRGNARETPQGPEGRLIRTEYTVVGERSAARSRRRT